jgi:hypothetical protein
MDPSDDDAVMSQLEQLRLLAERSLRLPPFRGVPDDGHDASSGFCVEGAQGDVHRHLAAVLMP